MVRRLALAPLLALFLAAPAVAAAAPSAAFELTAPDPCVAGACVATVTIAAPGAAAVLVEVDWAHDGPADEDFAPDAALPCAALAGPCSLTSPVLDRPGALRVAIRVTGPDGAQAHAARTLRVVRPEPPRETAESLCGPREAGVTCGPGNGRRTPGGNGKVSHKGWPAITGIFWMVRDDRGHSQTGGRANDELLGHHGDDVLRGAGGKDVLWGDWDPKNNTTRQRDRLDGGAGNDWLYSSHGRNTITGGSGNDYVWAYYGTGTIDCGPGRRDTARVRLNGPYRVRNCERIKNFCAFGSKPGGGCYKPGERPSRRAG